MVQNRRVRGIRSGSGSGGRGFDRAAIAAASGGLVEIERRHGVLDGAPGRVVVAREAARLGRVVVPGRERGDVDAPPCYQRLCLAKTTPCGRLMSTPSGYGPTYK